MALRLRAGNTDAHRVVEGTAGLIVTAAARTGEAARGEFELMDGGASVPPGRPGRPRPAPGPRVAAGNAELGPRNEGGVYRSGFRVPRSALLRWWGPAARP